MSILSVVSIVPVFAHANVRDYSSSWDFNMQRINVNGSLNNEFYQMDKGKMHLDGRVEAYFETPASPYVEKQNVKITVVETTWSGNRIVGSKIVTPDKGSFNKYLGEQPKGKYYIKVTKDDFDERYTSGNGTLYTYVGR